MVRERKTKLAERVISLLLAIVMTVSGTGLTAFASEFAPEDTEEPAVTEETTGAEEPEQQHLPEDESGEPEEPAEPENSDAVSAEPETPAQDPEVTEASDLPEEPKNPDTQPEEPQEPEQPDPVFKPLDLELKTEERITYTFVTEDEVIRAELTPAARLWGEEDYEQFEEFTDDLPEDQQIVQAFVIGDGTEQEIPVVFTETAEVFLSCDQWDWSDLTGADIKDRYTLYLSDTQGNLKPATFDVLLAEEEHNDHGDALVFDAAQLSVLVLAETVSVEEEVHDALVEVSASDSEPLLAEGELTAASRTALRSRQAPQQVAPGQQQPVSQDGTTIEKITVRWISNSTGSSAPAGFDRLVMAPENDRVPNQQFQIDFALSGKDDYEPGTIELIFPAYVWLDRNDKEPGVLTLSVPQDPENRTEF
ncbi:MAG: hypothetical protein IJ049_04915, partial [Oscillospiraceae bacterium]|nr:hypothetical protein [Oscillospiraceae bacterium]